MALFLRNLFWALLCPGTVALWLPCYILSGAELPGASWYWAGAVIIALGAGILIWCIYAFAKQGRGTLSPLDPAQHLVVRGLYRYVRNPMYVGVMIILLGETLLFGSLKMLGYAALVFVLFNFFIRLHEEPHLRRQFGHEYEDYCNKVGRWLPRRPW